MAGEQGCTPRLTEHQAELCLEKQREGGFFLPTFLEETEHFRF